MMRNAAVVGDPTTTGGAVQPGPLTTASIGGKHIASIGGKATCPACGSTGVIAISGGPYRETMYGHQIALEGDIVVCKCPTPPKLISTSSPKAQYNDHAETAEAVSPTASASKSSYQSLVNTSDGTQAAHYDEQLQLINAKGAKLDGVRYEIKLADGTTVNGVTDHEGRTKRVVTDTPQAVQEVTLQPKALEGCCSVHAEHSGGASGSITFKPEGVATNPTNIGSSVKKVSTPKGEARNLTAGETAMARQLFGDSVNYSTVKVHNGEYLWFGLQPNDTAMTPNGEMYFNPKRFQEDFSASSEFGDRLWFMHEMVHVWQFQLGYPVKLRGAIRIGLGYQYELTPNQKLSGYNMEAQGNVLSDYWAEVLVGDPPALWQGSSRGMKSDFERVLSTFIANPSDKRNLPGGE